MRKKVFSVLREMHWWYDHSGKPTRPEGEMKDADTAESLKHWLLHYMPDNEDSLADEDATASSLWDRLQQLFQLRVQGRRSFFVVVYSRRQRHRLLVLKVQVEGGGVDYTTEKWKLIPLEEREAHARRQSTY